ncbi:gamma-glutamyltransferase [Bacillus shivajii]|uniref:gamma-glutamyltransferase family protein n=1 Tax=Bacillus shivajii TaxID=1983719 RepID=UPI001CF97335|nr:gamma-glutamyltransferase [Bacillus shivajii]UCZ52990.1 gamma-glutamyltransferase [Bacillus shivajii]
MWLRRWTNIIGLPLILVFVIAAVIEVSPQEEEGVEETRELSYTSSINGVAVSAANPHAVEVGLDVMRNGGNAVDAAIAISFMLGVVEPYGSGIGGGGSMLIYDPTTDEAENQIEYIDYRETAPLQLQEPVEDENNQYVIAQNEAKLLNGQYFGVPGFLKGMAYLHEEYATLDEELLVEAAIDRANDGFTVDTYLAERFYFAQNRLHHADIPHFFPENRFLQEGDILVQNELAETLEEISEFGFEDYFYNEFAPEMVARFNSLTTEDFEQYEVLTNQTPSVGAFQEYDVYAAPPPLAGPVLVQALHMAEALDMDDHTLNFFNIEEEEAVEERDLQEMFDPAIVEDDLNFMEKMLAVNDLTYRDRLLNIGDPNTSQEAAVLAEEIVTREYADQLVSQWRDALEERQRQFFQDDDELTEEGTESFFRPKKGVESLFASAHPYYDARSELKQHNNTTHFVVIDTEGRMVSATHTLSNFFGSGVYHRGFFLNDQLSNFSQTEGSINEPAPGRRPRSFMTPAILVKNNGGETEEVIGLGSPGGARIPMMMAQVLMYDNLHGMDLAQAISIPRFQYDFNETNQQYEVRVESKLRDREHYELLRQGLQERGYPISVERGAMYFGGIQTLIHDVVNRQISGEADPRRGGSWDSDIVGARSYEGD